MGLTQKKACRKAGYPGKWARKIFQKPHVKEKVKEWMDKIEAMPEGKKEIIEMLRGIMNAPVGSVQTVSITIRESPIAGYDRTNPNVPLGIESRETVKRKITESDKIAAARELAVLLGYREEKTKVTVENDLIAELQKRREMLSESAEG